MVRVLGLLPYPTRRVPGQRFRIEQWAPLMAAEGVEMRFDSFLTPDALSIVHSPGRKAKKFAAVVHGYANRIAMLLGKRSFDAAFVYREAALFGNAWIEALLARRVPLVFDFDDAIYIQDSAEANRFFARLKSASKTRNLCRLARTVTVGNDDLARYARLHSAAVTVVPTTIDTDEYRVTPRPPSPRPVVGWSGSTTTLPYFEVLAEPLRELCRRMEVRIQVIGGTVSMPGVEVECAPWKLETEVEDLRRIDVGLMPLRDDEWSRGKCGLKALQYMALGIPPVISPVGVNAEIVRDGENGFHARNDAEWVDRIALLLRDPALRARLGAAARRTVEEKYSARAQAPRMAEVLRRAAASV